MQKSIKQKLRYCRKVSKEKGHNCTNASNTKDIIVEKDQAGPYYGKASNRKDRSIIAEKKSNKNDIIAEKHQTERTLLHKSIKQKDLITEKHKAKTILLQKSIKQKGHYYTKASNKNDIISEKHQTEKDVIIEKRQTELVLLPKAPNRNGIITEKHIIAEKTSNKSNFFQRYNVNTPRCNSRPM